MGTKHRSFTDSELHQPGIISADDPASTYGTDPNNGGVQAGHLWIEHLSGDADDLEALKLRNSANNGWVDILSAVGVPNLQSTTTGDLIYASAADTFSALNIGTEGQILTVSSGVPAWAAAPTEIPTVVTGDVLYASSSDTLAALTIGTDGQVLTVSSGVPVWADATGGGGGLAAGDTIPAADGTAGAPGLTFNSDTDNGLFRVTTDVIGVSTGGTERARFDSSGLGIRLDGTAVSPSIAWTNGETGLGFFRLTNNQLGFAANGEHVMNMTTGGLSILTGNQMRIDDGVVGTPGLVFDSDRNTGVYQPSGADTLGIATGGVVAFEIDASQNVILSAVPTSDPTVTGAIWSDGGTLVLSGSTAGGGGLEAGDTLLAADGTQTAPGIAFNSDTNTGLYLSAADTITLTTGGTDLVTFSGTGPKLENGSAASPSLAFTADTNVGLYRVTTDTLGVSCAGTAVAQFSSNGIFSSRDGTAAQPAFQFTTDTGMGLFRSGGNLLGFAADGEETMKMSSGGLSMQAGNQFRADDGSAATPGFSFEGDRDTGIYLIGVNNIGFSTAATVRMEIAADGGVKMNDLPTSDPLVAGELWNNSGVVNISAG